MTGKVSANGEGGLKCVRAVKRQDVKGSESRT